MSQREQILDIVAVLNTWKKPILGLSVLISLSTAVISLFLPNYYRATTVFLATNPNRARPEILFGKANAGVELYGSDDDIDRILAIAQSNELIDYLVDSFSLYEHYHIDSSQEKAVYKVRMHFRSLYQVQKTKLGSLELAVEDRDPELSAALANAARERISLLTEDLVKTAQTAILKSYDESLAAKQSLLANLGDSLSVVRAKYGIYNTSEHSERLTRQMIEAQSEYYKQKGKLENMRSNPAISRDSVAFTAAMVAGLRLALDSMEVRMQQLNTGQIAVGILETQYYSANSNLSDELERAKLLRASILAEVPSLVLVEAAEVPVVKDRPRRSLLVAASFVLALVLSVLGVLFIHAYRDSMRWSEK
ncbi:MAG: hypothetical protein ACKOAY_02500 [Haliscomenobacter sp.]